MQTHTASSFITCSLLALTIVSCNNNSGQQPGNKDSLNGVSVAATSPAESSILIAQRVEDKLAGRYDDVSDYAEGFVTVIKDGKYTFVDTMGKELMPPQFDRVAGFKNGYSFAERDGAAGMIDKEGKDVFPFRKDWEYIGPVEDGWASVKTRNEKYGFINLKGEIVIPTDYDNITVYDFKQGVAIASKGDKRGFIDKQNKVVTPFVYDHIHEFDGNNKLTIVQQGKKYGIIRSDGTLAHPVTLAYDDVGAFSNGFAYVKKGDLYGFIDTTGKEVLPLKWESASGFNEWGFAEVRVGNESVLIDKSGNPVMKSGYWQISQVADDRFIVSVEEGKRMGIVKRDGTLVMPMEYDNIMQMGEGLFLVNKIEGKQIYYADITGKKVADYRASGE